MYIQRATFYLTWMTENFHWKKLSSLYKRIKEHLLHSFTKQYTLVPLICKVTFVDSLLLVWDTLRTFFPIIFPSIGAENGNPLQYCCLGNPRDGGTWWAAVFGVAQSRTRLKQIHSSSSSISFHSSHFSLTFHCLIFCTQARNDS